MALCWVLNGANKRFLIRILYLLYYIAKEAPSLAHFGRTIIVLPVFGQGFSQGLIHTPLCFILFVAQSPQPGFICVLG